MDKKTEALKLALGYMKQMLMEHDEKYCRHPSTETERAAIVSDIEEVEEALAEQPAQQEPVAWWHRKSDTFTSANLVRNFVEWSPLYTSTPAKPWVGLTEQERNDLEDYCEMIIGKAAFEAIEAKIKEKNA